MSYVLVDVETDGPIPGDYSMIALGAVIAEKGLKKIFYAKLRPISERYTKERLDFLKLTRGQTLKYENPETVIKRFAKWVEANSKGKPLFVSDNAGFDWMFVCWYLWHFAGRNPFGYKSRDMSSIYKGIAKDMAQSFKPVREELTHNALEDAKANARVFLLLKKKYGLKI